MPLKEETVAPLIDACCYCKEELGEDCFDIPERDTVEIRI